MTNQKIFTCLLLIILTTVSLCGCFDGMMTEDDENNILQGENQGLIVLIGKRNYTKIQDAVNAASSGDTIFICNGTYYENVLIEEKKDIRIIGEDWRTTILRPRRIPASIIRIWDSTNITIANLTLKDASRGEGISIDSVKAPFLSTNNIITKCTFMNNSYGVITSHIVMRVTEDNKCVKTIYFDSPNNTIYNNIFINNENHAYADSYNLFYYNGIGNYWDGFSCDDKNNDYIGDTPYKIPGGNNKDIYPLTLSYILFKSSSL